MTTLILAEGNKRKAQCVQRFDQNQNKYLNILKKGRIAPVYTNRKTSSALIKNSRTISQRAISTTRLRTSLPFHLWPIDVVVFHGPLKKSHLVVGFALICFQRLSLPNVATQQCHWRDNWCTRGSSNPVLSY